MARHHVLAGTGRSAAGIPPNGTQHLYDEESRQKQLHNLQVSEEQSHLARSEPGDGLFTSTAAESQPLKITLLTVKCGFSCEASSVKPPEGRTEILIGLIQSLLWQNVTTGRYINKKQMIATTFNDLFLKFTSVSKKYCRKTLLGLNHIIYVAFWFWFW